MRNIFHDLYNGRFSAWERRPVRTEETKALNRKIEDEKRYFMQKMSLDDCQRFEALETMYCQASDFEQSDAFAYGFTIAIKLMFAVFVNEENPQ